MTSFLKSLFLISYNTSSKNIKPKPFFLRIVENNYKLKNIVLIMCALLTKQLLNYSINIFILFL